MEDRGKRVDWVTLVGTVLAAVMVGLGFAGLFAAVSRPVIETLQRL